jgi:hypothetical protein
MGWQHLGWQHLAVSRVISDIWDDLAASRSTWQHLGASGSIWKHQEAYSIGVPVTHLGLSCLTWYHLVSHDFHWFPSTSCA